MSINNLSSMTQQALLIINADDFGLTTSCTDAIALAFERNCISDTTIMATGEAFEYALTTAQSQGFFENIGIHFNLTEGEPLTDGIRTCNEFVSDGAFHGKINRSQSLSMQAKKAVYEELTAQITKVLDAGVPLTHADSHHHIHTALCIAPIFASVCREFGISKVRLHRNIGDIPFYKRVVKWEYNRWLHRKGFQTTRYFGSMEDVECIGVLDNLEIMVHPDFDKNGNLIDRTDILDGYPVGKPLENLTDEKNVMLKGYRDL